MPGPSGEFVGTIGTSVILALISSLVLSFTLIPALTAFTSHRTVQPDSFWTRGYASKWLSSVYRWSLRVSFRFPLATVLLRHRCIATGLRGFGRSARSVFSISGPGSTHLEIELSPQSVAHETRSVCQCGNQDTRARPAVVSVIGCSDEMAQSIYYNMIGTRQDSPRFAEALIQTRT